MSVSGWHLFVVWHWSSILTWVSVSVGEMGWGSLKVVGFLFFICIAYVSFLPNLASVSIYLMFCKDHMSVHWAIACERLHVAVYGWTCVVCNFVYFEFATWQGMYLCFWYALWYHYLQLWYKKREWLEQTSVPIFADLLDKITLLYGTWTVFCFLEYCKNLPASSDVKDACSSFAMFPLSYLRTCYRFSEIQEKLVDGIMFIL